MARRVRQAVPSEESRAASLLRECVTCVDLHYDASSWPGIVVPEPLVTEVPLYNPLRRDLWFLGLLIKKLRSDAENQIRCLTCYQEQDWQGPLFDPLSPKGVTDPHKRFLDTVEAMNQHHLHPGLLRFLPDGCEKVLWAPGPEAMALAASRRSSVAVRLNLVGASS